MDISSVLSVAVPLAVAGGAIVFFVRRGKTHLAPAPVDAPKTDQATAETRVPYGRQSHYRSAGAVISVEGPGGARSVRDGGDRAARKQFPNATLREAAPPYATGPDAHRDRIALVAFHERGFIMMRPSLLDSPRITERFRLLSSKIDGVGTNITDGLPQGDRSCQRDASRSASAHRSSERWGGEPRDADAVRRGRPRGAELHQHRLHRLRPRRAAGHPRQDRERHPQRADDRGELAARTF